MKMLIVSDSHGLTEELIELKKRHQDEVDVMIHCGDSELAAKDEALSDFITVCGNCDIDYRFPDEVVKSIEDVTFFVVHGHHHQVKSSLLSLSYRAKECGANIVCFGHSHYLGVEMLENTLYINPGSLRLPRGRQEHTYVILTTSKTEFTVEVYDYKEGILPALTQHFSRD
ncbi:metallophosphoesterase [Bacillaceae bacterium Marseille-Q3522]|nr:metallophosphoesterase [Bacillaceae bacterium Marseille-Q3522]